MYLNFRPDQFRALQLYEQGCPVSGEVDLRSCARLGELHERGVRGAPDLGFPQVLQAVRA